MNLSERIRSAPEPFEPDDAPDLSDLVEDLCTTSLHRQLFLGVASCSPYLSGLLRREFDWFRSIWDQPPENTVSDLLTWTRSVSANDDLSAHLRTAKRRAALLIALCDLGGVWDVMTVTAHLTRFADAAVDTALRHLMRQRFERGKLPGIDEELLETCAGVTVLAMGKMGAAELNYSSDIDLIVISDASVLPEDSIPELRAEFVRITRQLVKSLSEVTRGGYVFRTDLRLRPNPSTTPVCVSAEAALRYYESTGRTWERAALIKARPAAGDLAAGHRFLEQIAPFIWRRHLDFATVDAARRMQDQIRQHKQLSGSIRLAGHNIKLGPGGIRQIEFFAQTLQLITGGRDPEAREPGTLGALRVLARKGWVPLETSNALIDAYCRHRTLEHRLQMVQDIQTQTMPADDPGISRIAAFSGYGDVDSFRTEVRERLRMVNDTCSMFFEREGEDDDDNDGIPDDLLELSESWRDLPVLRSRSDVPAFERVRPKLLGRLASADVPANAIARFDEFLKGMPAGVQLFSLFEANPSLLDLLVDVCSNAPSLATYLAQNAAVMDALFDPSFFEPLGDGEELFEDLAILLGTTPDYEARLNAARIWMHKKHFQIGVLQLRGIAGVLEAARSYSDLAVACVRALLPSVELHFAERYGRVSGKGLAILAMGKLGSSEMTATSDLDLVVVYDAARQDMSDGPKPLAAPTYFARLTQALVTALSSLMTEGRLYNVDMRLRPSGRKGPVATSLESFREYQMNKAWTWEHLALSRARVIAGDERTAAAVGAIRRDVLAKPRNKASVFEDIVEMRSRISANRKSDDVWDVKTGEGGLLEIELLAQTLALVAGVTERHPKRQFAAAAAQGWIGSADLAKLTDAHDLLVQVQHVQRLLADERFDMKTLGSGGQAVLLALTGRKTIDDLENDLLTKTLECSRIIHNVLES